MPVGLKLSGSGLFVPIGVVENMAFYYNTIIRYVDTEQLGAWRYAVRYAEEEELEVGPPPRIFTGFYKK